MRRWNGWGDETVSYPIPTSTVGFIEQRARAGRPNRDIDIEDVISRVPKPRSPRHPLISFDPQVRLMHARGHSFPDWIALRTGQVDTFPDGVAFPMSTEDVKELLRYAYRSKVHLIPFGGGTSVCGHIDPVKGKSPVLTVDMGRMNRLVDLNPQNLLATFEAGILGPDLEAQLRAHGFTLGHYPQSFEYSTLGGWIATRSSGQQSLGYGSIDHLFAGGKLETPLGELILPPFPGSAAGPDLREMVLGSEGRLGVLTEACVRISPLPEREEFHAIFFPDFLHGIEAIRQILSTRLPLCMLRLSTASETATTLSLAGHENLIGALERLLAIRGLGKDKCLLLVGFAGKASLVRIIRGETLSLTSKLSGTHVGKTFGDQWHKSRFRTPYLRNSLWELGYGVEAIETAVPWASVLQVLEAIETAITSTAAHFNEKVHIFSHLSHVYPTGSSIYTTFIFRLSPQAEDTLAYWQAIKAAASQAILSMGGTISHHHGVGMDHLPYMAAEKGTLGVAALTELCHTLDPKGIMNPGKLV